jgi:hypothetical protein
MPEPRTVTLLIEDMFKIVLFIGIFNFTIHNERHI